MALLAGYAKKSETPIVKSRAELCRVLKNIKPKYTSAQHTAINAQCGMGLVYELGLVNVKDQVSCLMEVFGFDVDEPTVNKNADLSISQIIITDIVNADGSPNKSDPWYETKMTSIVNKTAGPVTINPNSENHIRHFTITPNMLVKIFNFHHKKGK